MINSYIFKALADRLLSGALGYDIAWPNVDYPAAGQVKDDIHLRVDFVPNETITYNVGKDRGLSQGLLQVSVIYDLGTGIIKPYDLASSVIALFPKGTILLSGDAKVIINRVPWASGPIVDDDETMIPITIPYEAYSI